MRLLALGNVNGSLLGTIHLIVKVEVRKADGRNDVCATRDVDDAGATPSAQDQREDQLGEQERADVVCRKVRLDAVAGKAVDGGANACIVDENVEFVCQVGHLGRCSPDGCEGGQVQDDRVHLGAYAVSSFGCFAWYLRMSELLVIGTSYVPCILESNEAVFQNYQKHFIQHPYHHKSKLQVGKGKWHPEPPNLSLHFQHRRRRLLLLLCGSWQRRHRAWWASAQPR